MKTVFITGADGFTGRRLFQHLKGRGYDVVAGVRNRARKLAFERSAGKALVCDVSDAISVARAVASVKPDVIYHLAGTSVANDAIEEPLTAYQSIVSGWANVLDGARRAVPRARVILASAADVYGKAATHSAPVTEDTTPQPINTFGALKAAAESIAQTFYMTYHLDLLIVRPFVTIGPGLPERFFYGNVARRLVQYEGAGPVRLELPDLNCERDVLHVQDVVDAYEKLLTDGKPSQVYNLCSGEKRTVRQLVEQIAREAGREVTLVDWPADATLSIQSLCGSNAKLVEQTGWRPTRSSELAVRDLVADLKTTKEPVRAAAS